MLRRSLALAVRPLGRRTLAAHAAAAPKPAAPPAAAGKGSFLDKFPKHPDYEGLEGVVRYRFPHNYQIVYAVLGFYGVLIGLSVVKSKFSASRAAANKPAPTKPDLHTEVVRGAIPSMEDEGFEAFMNESDENAEKWLTNLDSEDSKSH